MHMAALGASPTPSPPVEEKAEDYSKLPGAVNTNTRQKGRSMWGPHAGDGA